MKEIFDSVFSASLSGAVIILVILALRLVLKKAPKATICLLWLLAVVRLLVPIQIESPLSLQPDPGTLEFRTESPVIQETPAPVPAVPESTQGAEISATPTAPVVTPSEPVVTPNDPVVSIGDAVADTEVTMEVFDWAEALPYLWAAVACGFLVYTLISYLVLRRRVRDAVQVDDGIFECAAIDSPFLLGYVRPNIYLPAGLPLADIDHILAHERTHIRRLDNWFKLAGFLCVAVHWFNPLVWLAYGLLCRDIEMACDESVVRSMSLEDRKAYSNALVSCAATHRMVCACPVAFGEVSVKHRVLSVLNYRKPAFWISVVAIIALVFVAVCFVTDPVTMDPLVQCREALAQLQASDSYALYMTRSCDDVYLQLYRTAMILNHGEDRYILAAYTDWTYEYLTTGGTTYHRDTSLAVPAADLDYAEWGEYTITSDPALSLFDWLFELEWDDSRIALQSDETEDGLRTITVTVTDENVSTGYYDLEFRLDAASGTLLRVTRTIPESDPTMDPSVAAVCLVSTDGDAIGALIDAHYADTQGLGVDNSYTEEQLVQALEDFNAATYASVVYADCPHWIDYSINPHIYIKYCYACGNSQADLALLGLQLEYGGAVYVEPAAIQELYATESKDWLGTCIAILRDAATSDSFYVEIMDASKSNAFPTHVCLRLGDDWMVESFQDGVRTSRLDYQGSQFCRDQRYSGSRVVGDTGWQAAEFESAADALPWILTQDWDNTEVFLQSVEMYEWGPHICIQVPSQNVTLQFHFNEGEFSYVYAYGNGAYTYYFFHDADRLPALLENQYLQATGAALTTADQIELQCRQALEEVLNSSSYRLLQYDYESNNRTGTQAFWKSGSDWLFTQSADADTWYLNAEGRQFVKGTEAHPVWTEVTGSCELPRHWLADFQWDDERIFYYSNWSWEGPALTVVDASYPKGYYELEFLFDEATGALTQLTKGYLTGDNLWVRSVITIYSDDASVSAYISEIYQEALAG